MSETEQPGGTPAAAGRADTARASDAIAQETATAPEAGPAAAQHGSFPVVGIGASAGGLAAFEAFFSGMPAKEETGVAWVLVQHLAPDHKSVLANLVQRYTRMTVFEVEDGMAIRPDCAYIIPPNRDMALLHGRLQLLKPSEPRGLRLPIDFFFRSLAQDRREQAVCVVLSGTGSDGTQGARAVKGEGGLVVAQSLESSEHGGMPGSVIAAGVADAVLAPEEMPRRILSFVHHELSGAAPPAPAISQALQGFLKKVCVLLRDRTGHDFSLYKESTVVRRIQRRMALHQLDRPERYLQLLRDTPAEVDALLRDLLIGVTSFFRDPDAFAELESQVIPRLFANRPAGAPVRAWVCGCATGEEAYSIAMLLQEHAERSDQPCAVQVFATDVDRTAIEKARSGIFPASIAADLSPARLARHFNQDPDGSLRVKRSIRDLLVFSEQDVTRDPPFSRLGLISCRNVMIYMTAELQRRLLGLFHYALDPGGVLFLGTSETVIEAAGRFGPLDRKWKLFERVDDMPGVYHPVAAAFSPRTRDPNPRPLAPRGRHPAPPADYRAITERALLGHYAPAAVLVTGRGEILHIWGRTGRYLEPAPGDPGVNVLAMAREGLRRGLTVLLHSVVASGTADRRQGLRIATNGDAIVADVTVIPLAEGGTTATPTDLFLVIFEEAPPAAAGAGSQEDPSDATSATHEHELRLATLEGELQARDEYLQTVVEEMETSNEELRSSNEELQSVNEELQSTNEELETSKEELQSVNEELATLNAELQVKLAELALANNDMNNLLAGTGVATLFVDHGLQVTRFTPATTEVINLIEADIGRPVAHIASNLVGDEDLVADVRRVLDTLVPHEAEVRTRSDRWFMMRIRPYRTVDNVIEGAVLTFADITEMKRAQQALNRQRVLAESIIATAREPLLVLDGSLQLVSANPAFFRAFGGSAAHDAGRSVFELDDGRWDSPELRRLLEDVLPNNTALEDFELRRDLGPTGSRTIRLNARRVLVEGGRPELILMAFDDVTSAAGSGPNESEGDVPAPDQERR